MKIRLRKDAKVPTIPKDIGTVKRKGGEAILSVSGVKTSKTNKGLNLHFNHSGRSQTIHIPFVDMVRT